MKAVFVLLVGICMLHDLKTKTIPAIWIWICLGVATGYRAYCLFIENGNIFECLIAIVPGIILLLLSIISAYAGNGDGLLVIAVGLFWGWKKTVEILIPAFLLVAVFALLYLLIKPEGKNHRIPFVPFLFLAMMFQMKGIG